MKKDRVKYCTCHKCGHLIKYHEEDTFWDEHGSGYSTKLVKCNHCGGDHILKYEEDDWFEETK